MVYSVDIRLYLFNALTVLKVCIIVPEQGSSIHGGVVAATPLLTTLHPHDVKHSRGLLVTVTTQNHPVQVSILPVVS